MRRPASARSAAMPPACSTAAAAARRMAAGWPAISAMNMSGKFPNECTAHRLQSLAVVENPKIAVIGGGSTYTPELVEGLGLRAGRLGVDELVLHDIDQGRLDVVGGLAGRILRRQGFRGGLRLHHRPRAARSTARRSCSCSCGLAGSRPGSWTRPCRRGSAASARRRPARVASRRRFAPCPSCSSIAGDMAARRRRRGVAARLHEPGRAGRPGPDRRRPPRDRPVQHPDRVPAPAGRPARGSSPSRSSSSTSA